MDALTQLDAQCVKQIVNDQPITWGFGGKDYLGTIGSRDTMKMLTEGGFIADQKLRILVETAQFETATRPRERETITICVNADLIPCYVDDAVGSRVNGRITQIDRAGGGLTYTIGSVAR